MATRRPYLRTRMIRRPVRPTSDVGLQSGGFDQNALVAAIREALGSGGGDFGGSLSRLLGGSGRYRGFGRTRNEGGGYFTKPMGPVQLPPPQTGGLTPREHGEPTYGTPMPAEPAAGAGGAPAAPASQAAPGKRPGPQSGQKTPQNPEGLPTYIDAQGREAFDFSGSNNQQQQTGWANWLRQVGRDNPNLRGQRLNVMDLYNQAIARGERISPHPDYQGAASVRDGQFYIGDRLFAPAANANDPALAQYWNRYIPVDDNDTGDATFGGATPAANPSNPATTATTVKPGQDAGPLVTSASPGASSATRGPSIGQATTNQATRADGVGLNARNTLPGAGGLLKDVATKPAVVNPGAPITDGAKPIMGAGGDPGERQAGYGTMVPSSRMPEVASKPLPPPDVGLGSKPAAGVMNTKPIAPAAGASRTMSQYASKPTGNALSVGLRSNTKRAANPFMVEDFASGGRVRTYAEGGRVKGGAQERETKGRTRGFTYDDYMREVGQFAGRPIGSEGDYDPRPTRTREEWEAMSPAEQFTFLRSYGNDVSNGGTFGTFQAARPEDTAAFRQRFGRPRWDASRSGRPEALGADEDLIFGFGDPNLYYDAPFEEWAIDPSRIIRNEDGSWVMERSNVRGDWLQHYQDLESRTQDRRLRQGMTPVMLAAGAGAGLYGGDFLAEWGAAGGAGAGESAAFVAGTNAAESGGTLALNAAGTGTVPYVPTGAAAGLGAGSELALMENITPTQLGELAQLPQIQSAATGAGQSVMQWLSNPQNLMSALRLAGTVGGMLGGGGEGDGDGQVPLIPPPGGNADGTAPPSGGNGPGSGPPLARPTTLPPAAARSQLPTRPGERTAPQEQGSDINLAELLESLDPENFEGDPASFERWEEARGRFQPLEDMLLDEAAEAGGEAEQAAAAGRAGADVSQAFEQAREAQRRRMIAQGVNPDEGRGTGAEIDRLATLDKAKAAAGSKNLARLAEKERGFGRRLQAAGLGNQIASQALNVDQIGLNYDQAERRMGADIARGRADMGARLHEGAQQRGTQRYISDSDRDARYYDTDTRTGLERDRLTSSERTSDADRDARYYDVDTRSTLERERLAEQRRSGDLNRDVDRQRINAGIEQNNLQNQRQRRQDQGAGFETIVRGAGTVMGFGRDMGWWKDGGRVGLGTGKKRRVNYRDGARVTIERNYEAGARVRGPGSATSDSIRARVSNGEHVLNAEAVELLDAENPEMLDELNQKGLAIRRAREALDRDLESEVGLGS